LAEQVEARLLLCALPFGVDGPSERGDRLVHERLSAAEEQRGHRQHGEDLVLGQEPLHLDLVVPRLVVALGGEHQFAPVDAAGRVHHVEVGLGPDEGVAVPAAERIGHRSDTADPDLGVGHPWRSDFDVLPGCGGGGRRICAALGRGRSDHFGLRVGACRDDAQHGDRDGQCSHPL